LLVYQTHQPLKNKPLLTQILLVVMDLIIV
jgi:hypothetical protein